jgi:hypothetical protein
MPADFLRGYSVSDEKKLPPLEPTSSLSSSELPPADRSLTRILGAIDKTIQSFTTVAKMIHDEVTSQGKLNLARHEMAIKMLGKMRVELAVLTDQLRALITSNDIQLGATITARDALTRTREKLEEAVEDITGQHELMRAEDEEGNAPKAVRVFVVKVTNFMWPVAVRGGKAAAIWGVKLVGGFTALGGLAKILHDLLVGL